MGTTRPTFQALAVYNWVAYSNTLTPLLQFPTGGEKLPDWKAAANLVRKIAENYKLPYYTMSPTYSVCKNHWA